MGSRVHKIPPARTGFASTARAVVGLLAGLLVWGCQFPGKQPGVQVTARPPQLARAGVPAQTGAAQATPLQPDLIPDFGPATNRGAGRRPGIAGLPGPANGDASGDASGRDRGLPATATGADQGPGRYLGGLRQGLPPGAVPGPGAAINAAPLLPRPLGSVVRVGLLLPLSGDNAALGQSMLDAAQLALFSFADSHLELVVRDTQGTPEGAAAAAALAIGDGARLILGPLLAASVAAVAPQAQAAGVRVIAFSTNRAVAGNGVYLMGFLPGSEIERVLGYASRQGIRRVAVLVPDDEYGRTVIEAARLAAELLGVEVARVETYDPGAQDFSGVVRRLADFDSRRQALLDQRQELEGRDDEIAKRALARLEKLQTIGDVDFESLILADGGGRLLSVAALLPHFDIDPRRVRMLGTGQWDVPGLAAEPALLGGWYAAPDPAARAAFDQQFQSFYRTQPKRLATLAYDAMALAAVLARATGGPAFTDQALMQPSGFAGRDGVFRFTPEGVTERGLAILQVQRGQNKILAPAPASFTAGLTN